MRLQLTVHGWLIRQKASTSSLTWTDIHDLGFLNSATISPSVLVRQSTQWEDEHESRRSRESCLFCRITITFTSINNSFQNRFDVAAYLSVSCCHASLLAFGPFKHEGLNLIAFLNRSNISQRLAHHCTSNCATTLYKFNSLPADQLHEKCGIKPRHLHCL